MIPVVESSGGLVTVVSEGKVLGLFVSHEQDGLLQIPKGMVERGESLELGALREVGEESGCAASLICLLGVGEWDYEYEGRPFHEVCTYYLMSSPSLELNVHDTEFEFVQWVVLSNASQRMRYRLEADMIAQALIRIGAVQEVAIAVGHGLWGESASGEAAWSPLEPGGLGAPKGRSQVLFRDELLPRDAGRLKYAAAIVADRGGPASHLAVVAAGMQITSVSEVALAIVGRLCHLDSGAVIREGCRIRVDGRTGTVWASLTVDEGGHEFPTASEAVLGVHSSIARICAATGLSWPGNYKFFKRDLAAQFFRTPPRVRLGAGWTSESALGTWRSMGGQDVRISLFPEDIACHAVSLLLVSDEEEVMGQLRGLEHQHPCEIFVQQSENRLAFRAVIANGRAQIEAGIGQAMYIFETERGAWPTSQCELSLAGEAHGVITGTDAKTSSVLSEFVERHSADLLQRMTQLVSSISATHLSVEGYYDVTSNDWVVVDVDLPEDKFFMGSQGTFVGDVVG